MECKFLKEKADCMIYNDLPDKKSCKWLNDKTIMMYITTLLISTSDKFIFQDRQPLSNSIF